MGQVDEDRLLKLIVEWDEMRDRGESVSPEQLCPDDLELQDALRRRIARRLKIEQLIATPSLSQASHSKTPESQQGISPDQRLGNTGAGPVRIGRYRIERLLGAGGFGQVYLAYDEDLQRYVAVKIPHAELLKHADYVETYRREARFVASLDHPNIVPVYDVGSSEQFTCFIVSKFIAGTNLYARMNQSRLSFDEVARIVATVAGALNYTHALGLIHRDIKPVNILLSLTGEPFLVDFGLAMNESDAIEGRRFAGTPAYMSPEQARGEAHRVDGRSDIYSLGVVLYELLTQQKPQRGESDSDLLKQIVSVEPIPPCEIDATIPKELERICLKALSKRASDRYRIAQEFAQDLRCFCSDSPKNFLQSQHPTAAIQGDQTNNQKTAPRVVPKGLRSYEPHDAGFFLDLLPGPRDREGWPESIRFWKNRIEAIQPDEGFSVGMIYGPSGCGKTSLMKAGVVPCLSNQVVVIYLEATPDETESKLLHALRKRCPGLPDDLNLDQTITRLRKGYDLPVGKKVLIVIDQFEQWLQVHRELSRSELSQALRQCDGNRVQAIILVRDDFWLAVSRFMQELEVRLVDGQNCSLVDLFDLEHATKVLEALGRAYGKLPETSAPMTKEQRGFLDQSVKDLANDGRVVPVRLSLFAEMMKNKTWQPTTLKAMGGIEGVGTAFLEEMFGDRASLEHRHHESAIFRVLELLLPDHGTQIKGNRRSYAELMQASGYVSRPDDFVKVLAILDRETRLITPTESDGLKLEQQTSSPQDESKYYQLTHDYLVPSLREWLVRKQKETRQGRSQFLLQEWSSIWNSRPGNRNLPGLISWCQILTNTRSHNWTNAQQKMMRAARDYYLARAAGLGLILLIATTIGLAIRSQVVEYENQNEAQGLLKAVVNAEIARIPAIVDSMSSSRKWVNPLLRDAIENTSLNPQQKLNASLALLRVDGRQIDYVYHRLLQAAPEEVPVLCAELMPYRTQLTSQLWELVQSTPKSQIDQRLRAASALARFDPEGEGWNELSPSLTDQLVNENPFALRVWNTTLRPVKSKLLGPLAAIYRNRSRSDIERTVATNFLVDYAADEPELLADLLMDSDEKQFVVIFPKFLDQVELATPFLERVIQRSILEAEDAQKESLAQRQANAAAALLKINRANLVWQILKQSPDHRARSYLIHRVSPLGVDPQLLVARIEQEADVTIRRALYLSLGEFDEQALDQDSRTRLIPKLQEIYRNESDPGLRAVAEFLLRKWNEDDWLKQVVGEWTLDQEHRKTQFENIRSSLKESDSKTPKAWYVNSMGQTMIVMPGPTEFIMGSDEVDTSPISKERRHRRRIDRSYAIATTHVTLEQYRHYDSDYAKDMAAEWTRSPDLPVIGLSWFMAALYCNWLNERDGIPADQACFSVKGRVLRLKKNYLKLTGYRLPTEAEMEYATRADTTTSRYFGETEGLLPHYAWYQANSLEKFWPVATKKPNDFGLFDTHGNVFTWCIGTYQLYPETEIVEDNNEELTSDNATPRALRGGSFIDRPPLVRSAFRNADLPVARNHSYGFRVVRTIAPVTKTTAPETPADDEK